MHFELADCEATLLEEIEGGQTQKSVALTYAMALTSRERASTDWPKVNRAILARWPKGLDRVKRMAWRLIEEKLTTEPRP